MLIRCQTEMDFVPKIIHRKKDSRAKSQNDAV